MKHELKTWPEYFQESWKGHKPFEIRKNDRSFKIHDEVLLREYDPNTKEYTGRTVSGFISYITKFEQKDGFVVLGLVDLC